MKIRFGLQTRFLAWITLLLVVLVGAILLIIGRREVATIAKESQARALLIARAIADRNLQLLLAWDQDGILRNIESQIDDTLLYAVLYDRYATPLVYNRAIEGQSAIYSPSRLQGETGLDAFAAERRRVWLGGRVRMVIEVEVPMFSEATLDKWGSVKIGMSLEDAQSAIRRTRLALILIGLAGFLLGLAGATMLARRIARPLRRLVDGTVRISRGDFVHRIPVDSRDEIGDLATAFNDMAGKLLAAREKMQDAQRKLVQAEKLAQIGRMTATIAHEIRNPLTSVKLNIQKVAEDESLTPVEREHLGLSQQGVARIEKFIKELLNFTRPTELQRAAFSIQQILDETVKMVRDAFAEKKIDVDIRVAAGLPEIDVDGDRMRQVFLNILRNAVEAVESEGWIAISAEAVEDGGVRKLRVRISDDGCGVAPKDRETIFEPFYTTKPWGFGLGLANARKLVELHGGTVRIVPPDESVLRGGRGTTFEILIPFEGEP